MLKAGHSCRPTCHTMKSVTLPKYDAVDEIADGSAEDQTERQVQPRLARTALDQVVHDER